MVNQVRIICSYDRHINEIKSVKYHRIHFKG